MKLLDLFCGAGGCAMGYHQAGFEVIGVDIAPQLHYPFEYVQGDAMEILQDQTFLSQFDLIHASPPCQEYSVSRHLRDATTKYGVKHAQKLVSQVRARLSQTGVPWVIENVAYCPDLPDAVQLCGSMFGLPIRRHRWFACSHYLYAPRPCRHTDRCINVIGNKVYGYGAWASQTTYLDANGRTRKRESNFRACDGQAAMGIDWMTIAEMSQAVPPAYTKWIGLQLIDILKK